MLIKVRMCQYQPFEMDMPPHPFPAMECCVVLAFSPCMVHIYKYDLKYTRTALPNGTCWL